MFTIHCYSLSPVVPSGELSGGMLGGLASSFDRKVHCRQAKSFDEFVDETVEKTNDILLEVFGFGSSDDVLKYFRITSVVYVRNDDQLVASCLVGRPDHKTRMIHGLCVKPEFRGKGLGSALVRCLPLVFPAGIRTGLLVTLGEDNTDRLIAWYERLGFVQTKGPASYDEVFMMLKAPQ